MTLIFSTRGSFTNENDENKKNVSRIFSTSKTPLAIGPYSKAFVAGGFLYCSGQVGLDPNTMELVLGGIEEETKQVCRNIANLLLEHSYSLKDVVKVTVYLKNMNDFEKVNDLYKNYFVMKPARTIVGVSSLPKGASIQIEVVAYQDPDDEERNMTKMAFPELN